MCLFFDILFSIIFCYAFTFLYCSSSSQVKLKQFCFDLVPLEKSALWFVYAISLFLFVCLFSRVSPLVLIGKIWSFYKVSYSVASMFVMLMSLIRSSLVSSFASVTLFLQIRECILWLSIVFITILCTPQLTVTRWSTNPPVSADVLHQWKGFCAIIANAYYVKGMAW